MDESTEVHLAGRTLDRSRHVCAFFHTADDEYGVLMPFIKEGFDRNDKAFHIVDPDLMPGHLRRLTEAGIDTEAARESGRLEVRGWEEAYLRGQRFDQDAMLELIEEVLEGGHKQGFPMTRLVAHMEWALEDRPGVTDLLEYETRLNYLLPRYPDPVI